MTGQAYLIRLAGYGVRRPKNPVRGREVAGQVEATGKDVTRFQPGDEVMGTGEGSFAEYARAREDKLAPKPTTSPSSRRRPSRFPHLPPCRLFAIKDRYSPGRRF